MPRYRNNKRPPLDDLLKDAASRGGLFTTKQAEEQGISRKLLSYYTKQGKIERVARSVYKSPYAGTSPHEDVIAHVLPYGELAGATGPSALDVYNLGSLAADKVYVEYPAGTTAGPIPSQLTSGTVSIPSERPFKVTERDGVPVVSVEEALRTTVEYTDYDPDQVESAFREAVERGLISDAYRRKMLEDES